MTNITLYDYQELADLIEEAAEKNDGEISETDMQLLVQAQTGAIEKLSKLVGYMKYLSRFAEMAKAEADAVRKKAKTAENRLDNIKHYLIPYLQSSGGKVDVGIHTLSLRKSEGVVLEDGFNNSMYCTETTVLTPDKKKIKESIKSGIMIKGATLEKRESVVVK